MPENPTPYPGRRARTVLAIAVAGLSILSACSRGSATDGTSSTPAATTGDRSTPAESTPNGGAPSGSATTAPSAATSPATTSSTDSTPSGSTRPPDTPTQPTVGPSASTDPVAPPTPLAPEDGGITWSQFNDAVDVGALDVPIDYDNPDGPTIELFLARHNATDPNNRIGTLLVNPGGPGFGGSNLAIKAEVNFDAKLLARFDIIGWDPRGTGQSELAIDCIDNYDPYFTAVDLSPTTPDERSQVIAAAQQFATACQDKNATMLNEVGTNNSARDMNAIRVALGEPKISYFGFSYGSELGATWATLFPETVRAAVLDGASDPSATPAERAVNQLRGFEDTFNQFLVWCQAKGCAFAPDGNARQRYLELLDKLDARPAKTKAGRPPASDDVAVGATIEAMYSDAYWPLLETSLAAAERGDGSGLLALYDEYFQRKRDGTYGNEIEAFQVIGCADSSERLNDIEMTFLQNRLREAAPSLVRPGQVGDYFCRFMPPATDPRVPITGAGAGPILVIGTTHDPATPLESTRAMADALENGVLVSVDANRHTGYGVNRCVVDAVDAYLIDLVVPATGTDCGPVAGAPTSTQGAESTATTTETVVPTTVTPGATTTTRPG